MRVRFLLTLALGAGMSLIGSGLPTAAAAKNTGATVYQWVDGDTVSTDRGMVRLIGMDTPEIGQCGYGQATREVRQLSPVGSQVVLKRPTGTANRDSYRRLLRYVVAGGVDVGRHQIERGAAARYDSRDGFPNHPRQKKYRRADRASLNYCGSPLAAATYAGSYRPISSVECPAEAQVKGNLNSMIFHVPGGFYYASVHPEECFVSEGAAMAAGYRKALK
jgi:endonuclease YncB( thermonuclease family)